MLSKCIKYKNSNQVIPLRLRGMVFTVFTKDIMDKKSVNLMKQPNISMAQAYVLFSLWNQLMTELQDVIALSKLVASPLPNLHKSSPLLKK